MTMSYKDDEYCAFSDESPSDRSGVSGMSGLAKLNGSSQGNTDSEPIEYSPTKNNPPLKQLSNYWEKSMKRDRDGKNVQWMKIRQVRVEKEFPAMLKIKYDFDEDLEKFLFQGLRGMWQIQSCPCSMRVMLPTLLRKRRILFNSQCDTGVVPPLYHHYYRKLKAVGDSDSEESQSVDGGHLVTEE